MSHKQSFTFYLDESGSPKPNPKDQAPYFAVGGVLIRREDENVITQQIQAFKKRWDINPEIALHGNEIRSRKKNFAWLGRISEKERLDFMHDLTDMITKLPITVHACVVSRQGYLNRYLERYGQDTWEMMKSSFSILMERIGKYVVSQDGEVMIFFEKAGKKEDHLITSYFNDLRSQGLPFNPKNSGKYQPLCAETLQGTLVGIDGKSKGNPIMQISDLCLYPVARAKENPVNQAFLALVQNARLIDCVLEDDQLEAMGIKYYCFDHLL